MKKNVLTIGIIAFFVLNSVAFAVVGGMNFKDQYKFADWNRSAIDHLQQEGIVKGYGDGEFKPENNVTRAEMAVMMDRLYNRLVGNVSNAMLSYDELKDVTFESIYPGSGPKIALAMSMAGLKKVDYSEIEKINSACGVSNFSMSEKMKGSHIPKDYDVYELGCEPITYFVHWKTEKPMADGSISSIDEWYGPFYPSVWYNNG